MKVLPAGSNSGALFASVPPSSSPPAHVPAVAPGTSTTDTPRDALVPAVAPGTSTTEAPRDALVPAVAPGTSTTDAPRDALVPAVAPGTSTTEAPRDALVPAVAPGTSTTEAPRDALVPAVVPGTSTTDAPRDALTLSLPEDASTHGHRIDELLAWSHRFDAVLIAVALGWLVLAVWRFHQAKQAASDGGTRRSRAWVLGLALGAFAVVDGTLLLGSEGYLRDVLWNFHVPAEDPRTVRIEINAHQWSWEARYAGADGRFGTPDDVVTWNDLRVPVGAPVWVQLVSTDVVHGFSLPHFRVKLDAIPGRVNQTWFQAAREGAWEAACYQHCGTSHYRMRGVLTAMSPESYATWLREAGKQATQAYDAEDLAAHWGWEWKAP